VFTPLNSIGACLIVSDRRPGHRALTPAARLKRLRARRSALVSAATLSKVPGFSRNPSTVHLCTALPFLAPLSRLAQVLGGQRRFRRASASGTSGFSELWVSQSPSPDGRRRSRVTVSAGALNWEIRQGYLPPLYEQCGDKESICPKVSTS
jgi:hypothetical protein